MTLRRKSRRIGQLKACAVLGQVLQTASLDYSPLNATWAVPANPQKTVLFLLGVCYRTHNMLGIYYHTEEVPSFLRHREYVHCIAYTLQCAFCYCCAYQPSPSNDCTQQSLLSNDCAQQHMLCIDMLLVPLPLPSLALHTTCAATTARANTCFALTYCL